MAANLKWAKEKAKQDGINLCSSRQIVVLDAQAGKNFSNFTVDYSPTITRTRGMSRGYMLLGRGWQTFMTTEDLARLQGTTTTRFNLEGLTDCQVGGMAGNAMSRNVLDRILPRLLWSCGCLDRRPGQDPQHTISRKSI